MTLRQKCMYAPVEVRVGQIKNKRNGISLSIPTMVNYFKSFSNISINPCLEHYWDQSSDNITSMLDDFRYIESFSDKYKIRTGFLFPLLKDFSIQTIGQRSNSSANKIPTIKEKSKYYIYNRGTK